MKKEDSVIIREVVMRDGLQSIPAFVETSDKLELIRKIALAGVKVLEITSFVSPKAIPQLKDAAEVLNGARGLGPALDVLVPNITGAMRALSEMPDRLVVFVSASESHNRANVGMSIDDSMKQLEKVFEMAREKDVPVTSAIAVSFGCPYEGNVPRDRVLSIAKRFFESGVDIITLGDTTGMASPNRIKDLTGFILNSLPDARLCLHLHNNRGIAMANLYEGYREGIRIFDAALGGIGGCPNVPKAAGNLCTEDVVFMFDEMGVETGIDLMKLIEASHALETLLGYTLPGQVMKSGPRDPELARRCTAAH